MSSRKRILAHPAVEELWQEHPQGRTSYEAYDGDYWVGLHNGWCCPLMECHTIHEATLKEVWDMVVECIPCACLQCRPENPETLQDCRCSWTTPKQDEEEETKAWNESFQQGEEYE